MISAQSALDALTANGYGLATGVPCSYFAGVLRLLERGAGPRYVAAVNEGSAIAIAAGAELGGQQPVVLAQNSGFGNMINPLTSLVLPYRIPMTVMVSMRGWPTASAGEPQHYWMGRVMPDWLESLGIAHWMLTTGGPPLAAVLRSARPILNAGRPAFILVAKGVIADDTPRDVSAAASARTLTREEVVATVVAEAGDDAYLLSTTGYLSRSLFNLGDRDRNFYMQGSMGHVAGVALGAALAHPESRFVVLDGDGAVLMHMGCLATIGDRSAPNLTHVIFDNGVYDSTGGQPTGAHADFASAALACGYHDAWRADTTDELCSALRAALATAGPAAIVVGGAPGGDPGERASSSVSVDEIGDRFRKNLAARAHAVGGWTPA
jgi:phosphonopyruvate decarboxylase